ncbi:MAG: triose-phosphate isomerase [Candidatus Nealsonbacteria bacterium]|nr:MAG: triose-phosphate isomerase [Candidatus Nealsonbacteria bacterium]
MRKPLIVANWKMNPPTLKEARRIFRKTGPKKTGAVICPPFCYLSALKANGAQDCHYEEKGAYTGEVSPKMLRDLGVEYVILGHSERRKYQKETDWLIEKKLKAVMRAGLRPILCIDKISQIPKKIKRGYILAYEPLFAIGTGKPCSIEKAKKMRDRIKKKVKVLLLYGGSVNSSNAQGYIKEAGFDGLLVGGDSLKPREFIDIVKKAC